MEHKLIKCEAITYRGLCSRPATFVVRDKETDKIVEYACTQHKKVIEKYHSNNFVMNVLTQVVAR